MRGCFQTLQSLDGATGICGLPQVVVFSPLTGKYWVTHYQARVVFFFWLHHAACGILVPPPGIEPVPPAVEAWSLNHWTAREVPGQGSFYVNSFPNPTLSMGYRWVGWQSYLNNAAFSLPKVTFWNSHFGMSTFYLQIFREKRLCWIQVQNTVVFRWPTYIFKNFIYFIYFWLCWVFVAAHGLSLVAASGGYSLLRCAGFSLRWLLFLRSTGSRRTGSVVVVHGLSCSAACGIFWDQGLNPCSPYWQTDP